MASQKIASIALVPSDDDSKINITYKGNLKDITVYLIKDSNDNSVREYSTSLFKDFVTTIQEHNVVRFVAHRSISRDIISLFETVCGQYNPIDTKTRDNHYHTTLTPNAAPINPPPGFGPDDFALGGRDYQNRRQNNNYRGFFKGCRQDTDWRTHHPQDTDWRTHHPQDTRRRGRYPPSSQRRAYLPPGMGPYVGPVSDEDDELDSRQTLKGLMRSMRQPRSTSRASNRSRSRSGPRLPRPKPRRPGRKNSASYAEILERKNQETNDDDTATVIDPSDEDEEETGPGPLFQPAGVGVSEIVTRSVHPVMSPKDSIRSISDEKKKIIIPPGTMRQQNSELEIDRAVNSVFNVLTTTKAKPPNWDNTNRRGIEKIKNFVKTNSRIWLRKDQVPIFVKKLKDMLKENNK